MQHNPPNTNPWTEIPLADYERHMSDVSVGQSGLLSSLTKKCLEQIKPETCIFLGVAGGNGLEHLDRSITKQVTGIDINQTYLGVCANRYSSSVDNLQLLNLDITKNTDRVCPADFIWAALVLEYTGIESCLEFAKNNILPGGHFIVTIQANNNLQSVSPTGIESVKKAGSIFRSVEPDLLLSKAKEIGFKLAGDEENRLPNGKAFLTFDFAA